MLIVGKQIVERASITIKIEILNNSEQMERHIDNNNIVSEFLNQTSVENDISINSDDEISGVAVNISCLRWQSTVIYPQSRFVIIIISDIVEFL